MVAERKALRRLGDSTYLHPHGYVIERQRRTWNERVGRMRGQADTPPPLFWWTVSFHVAKRASMVEGRPAAFLSLVSEKRENRPQDFDTLRDARAWCDENPREGWS
jgi:hypothetical protein